MNGLSEVREQEHDLAYPDDSRGSGPIRADRGSLCRLAVPRLSAYLGS